tara:strand:- start:907 stop:1422 length:516 start_codon:yes stop_codon:yes gene_type:complete
MHEKLAKLFLLFLLFLLQSCSGGKIGNFLESSFKNIELIEENTKENRILNEKNNISKNQSSEKLVNKYSNQEIKSDEKIKYQKKENIKNDKKSLIEQINKPENLGTNKKDNFKLELNKREKNFKPQSYKITVILNEVDPTSPLERFSDILRNSNLNFEIENIQRYPNKKDE